VSLVRPGRDAVELDFNEVLQNAVRFAGEELARREVTALTTAGEIARVTADPWRLLRALLNMILWAAERMPSGGTISAQIRVFPGESQIECRLADTGAAIVPEEVEALFEPLDPKSSGALGLPAARTIMEEIGGRVWAEQRPTGGMVLCVRLPLAAEMETGERASAAG
jgi:signal transduction histidine kinase